MSLLKNAKELGKAAGTLLFGERQDNRFKEYEKNITYIGTRGSSKTTSLGCIDLVCEIESARNPKFTYRIDERTSGGISQISADLCRGVFPKATPKGKIYQADIYLTWKNGWRGDKTICIPVAETAGEDIENLMGIYRGDEQYKITPLPPDADNLIRKIAASQGLILTIAVPRESARFPQKLDKEPSSIHETPDLNAMRILNAIFQYKQATRGAQPVEGIAVLLTKYDMVDQWLERMKMDLYDPVGAQRYLTTYFRKTIALLKNFGMERVKFFPVHVMVEKDILKDGTVRFHQWDGQDGKKGDKIAINYDRNLPKFSEQVYFTVLEWIRETFAS